jgi:hypothetical protein
MLMRLRVAKVHQNPIPYVLGDKAVEAGDRIGDAAMIQADDLAQVFGIQARRERRRADQIAEQHGELPAFRKVHCKALYKSTEFCAVANPVHFRAVLYLPK